MDYLTNIGIAYLAYFVGAASPGPSNIAIMQISLEKGRGAGLALGLGVLTASVFWGNLTAFGLVSVWIKYPVLISVASSRRGRVFLMAGLRQLCKNNEQEITSGRNKQENKFCR